MRQWKLKIAAGCSEVVVGGDTIGRVRRAQGRWFAEDPEGNRVALHGAPIDCETRKEAARLLFAACSPRVESRS